MTLELEYKNRTENPIIQNYSRGRGFPSWISWQFILEWLAHCGFNHSIETVYLLTLCAQLACQQAPRGPGRRLKAGIHALNHELKTQPNKHKTISDCCIRADLWLNNTVCDCMACEAMGWGALGLCGLQLPISGVCNKTNFLVSGQQQKLEHTVVLVNWKTLWPCGKGDCSANFEIGLSVSNE